MFRNYGKLAALGMAIVLVAAAANVQADFIYNFDGLNKGQLVGQDSWELGALGTADQVTIDDTAVTNWNGSGKYAKGGNQTTLLRTTDLSWLQDNVSFDISVLGYVKGGSQAISMLGVQGTDATVTAKILLAGTYFGDEIRWFIGTEWGGTGVWTTLDLKLASGVSASYTVGIEATANGNKTYSLQPYYIDSSGTRVDHGSPLTSTVISDLGGYWARLQMRAAFPGMIDNFKISQVPEPSTLALLACGLFGLLAYAWRKRK